jgi:hydroxyquinol 1,2-dioxygenase
MRNLTEHNVTEAVLQTLDKIQDARLKEVMISLVKHLHTFVREVELTEAEWLAAIQFLTATGQMCNESRQEFILLSDTLGVSVLVDAINHRKVEGATVSTVLGPFYREGAAEVPPLHNIAGDIIGEPVVVFGQVTTPEGRPIPGALLDIWQASAEGFYDVQEANQPEMNLRGKLRTDEAGHYIFRTIKPSSYPIPYDGPVGKMLKVMGRHPYRPAHIHFIVSAEGYQPVVTHIFVEGDPYLDSDAVFGVKDALIADFVRHDSPEEAAKYDISAPFYTVEYKFGLQPV